MITINESQLLSAVKQVFAKTKSEYLRADKMEQLLLDDGLTPQEAKQAISLAEDKDEIQVCYPFVDEIRGERSYELLTEEDRKLEDELDEEPLKKHGHRRNP